jgi:hypothetical protein
MADGCGAVFSINNLFRKSIAIKGERYFNFIYVVIFLLHNRLISNG